MHGTNIITFKQNYYKRKTLREKKMNTWGLATYEEIRRYTENNLKNNYTYSMAEVDDIASRVLCGAEERVEGEYTPIVSIARQFGFNVYKGELRGDLSGFIQINDNLRESFNTNRIIMVNEKENLGHQRFVIAHELGHFLFGYNSDENNGAYYNTYTKNNHTDVQECLANRFAASLLMPKDLFIFRYKKAKAMDDSILFIESYLSKFFKTSVESIRKRIQEVL